MLFFVRRNKPIPCRWSCVQRFLNTLQFLLNIAKVALHRQWLPCKERKSWFRISLWLLFLVCYYKFGQSSFYINDLHDVIIDDLPLTIHDLSLINNSYSFLITNRSWGFGVLGWVDLSSYQSKWPIDTSNQNFRFQSPIYWTWYPEKLWLGNPRNCSLCGASEK